MKHNLRDAEQMPDALFNHVVRLMGNIGLLVLLTALGALVSNLFDPHHGVLTLVAYALRWIAAFCLIGFKTPEKRWPHLLATATLFLFLGHIFDVRLKWEVALLLFIAAGIGGGLSERLRSSAQGGTGAARGIPPC